MPGFQYFFVVRLFLSGRLWRPKSYGNLFFQLGARLWLKGVRWAGRAQFFCCAKSACVIRLPEPDARARKGCLRRSRVGLRFCGMGHGHIELRLLNLMRSFPKIEEKQKQSVRWTRIWR
jgi:hypothetical protein